MNIYLGLFLISLSGLSLEITLVRLLSVTTWYHLAFFAISTAMLGMTAGAVKVFLSPHSFSPERRANAIWHSCLYYTLSIPVTLMILCAVPLNFGGALSSIFRFFITTAACALPFFFTGSVVSAVLTKYNLPMGKLYASDLIGASAGCLFVLGGLEIFDAPSLILICGGMGALAAIAFGWKETSIQYRAFGHGLMLLFFLIGVLNSSAGLGIRPLYAKGARCDAASQYDVERWNSFSRVAVYKERESFPQLWGPSPLTPRDTVSQHYMDIDGDAGTTVRRFSSIEDIEHLRYDVTNIAYHLGRQGKTLIIGAGGGRDVQSAVLFGQEAIVGIEINPIFVNLLEEDFRVYAGVADRPEVKLITAEARSHLARSAEKFAVIQMSMIDTWAATGAGAYSLTENSLYTAEAWNLFYSRLEDNGVFTVSRWRSPEKIGETGRVVSLAVTTLLNQGIECPAEHLAMFSARNISTLIMSRQPLTKADIDKIIPLEFEVVFHPGHPPSDRILRSMLSARTESDLRLVADKAELNYRPPTDESPYFFNMLKIGSLGKTAGILSSSYKTGALKGNMIATATLIGLLLTLMFFTLVTIVLPLALRKRFRVESGNSTVTLCSGALYFALIGAGFMLTEIALIQRLTVLLSHPIYALGILLFTLIASAGLGSALSDRLPLTKIPGVYLYPVITAASLIGLRYLLKVILAETITASIFAKILISVAVIFPMGLLMGLFFPTGMRLVKAISPAETPWYWALNGIFGVLCSALAVFISIYIGISVNFYLAALCYAAALFPLIGMQRKRAKSE